MPPPPPLKDVLEALQQSVLPGAGAAALVMCVFLIVGRWRLAALGSAAAVVVAFMCGNFTLGNLKTADPLPTWANTSRVLLWVPDETSPGYQWLPRLALVLVATGVLTRWLGMAVSRVLPPRLWWLANVVVWWPRAWALFIVSAWLIQGAAAAAPQWEFLRWELAVTMLLVWIVLDGVARGGVSGELSVYLAAAFFTGSVVLLYSHNARFMDLAVLVGSAMFGIAVALLTVPEREDGVRALAVVAVDKDKDPQLIAVPERESGGKTLASGAIPAAVAFLPGLLLGTRPSHTDNKVPAIAFWLVALAPLVLAPFLIPRVSRQNRWLLLVLRAILILSPLIAAVVLAGQNEKFPYEDEPPEW